MKKINKFNQFSLNEQVDDDPGASIREYNQLLRSVLQSKNYVSDGVYDISELDYCDPAIGWRPKKSLIEKKFNELKYFIEKYPNFAVAKAYQTEYPLLISEMPTKQIKYIGSGFNHGSNNIIDNCPKRILICGEDD